jgi:hypothetical protein
VTEPTEWISPAFFVEKPNGRGARMVCDFTGINRFIQRPVHPFPSTQDLLSDIGAGANSSPPSTRFKDIIRSRWTTPARC